MRKKPIKDITVREITELTDISRGTFYLHYQDIFDMVEQIEDEVLADIRTLMARYTADMNALAADPNTMFSDIFTYIKNEAALVEVLTGPNGNVTLSNKIKQVFSTTYHAAARHALQKDNPDLYALYFSFVFSGTLGIMQAWLETGMRQTPQEVAEISIGLVTTSLNMLESK